MFWRRKPIPPPDVSVFKLLDDHISEASREARIAIVALSLACDKLAELSPHGAYSSSRYWMELAEQQEKRFS